MTIIPLEIIADRSKKMGKFGAIGKVGKLVKYQCDFGFGHAYMLDDEDDKISLNDKIEVETMYRIAEEFKISDDKNDAFYELNEKCNYSICGEVLFVYKNFEKVELISIKCGEWEFFVDDRTANLSNVETGMRVEFRIKDLELYNKK